MNAGYDYENERMILVLGTLAFVNGTSVVLNLLLSLCYKYNWFEKYRINKDAYPEKATIIGALKHLFVVHWIVRPVISYYVLFPLLVWRGMPSFYDPLPSWNVIMTQLMICYLSNDTLFYWAHRTLHHRLLYKHIHKKHHEFKKVIGISAEYAHPIEDLLSNMLPTLSGPIICACHPIVLWLWTVIRLTESIEVHSGFQFPYSPFKLIPFQGEPERHFFHHEQTTGCYSDDNKFWDWICGTDQNYLQAKERSRIAKKLQD